MAVRVNLFCVAGVVLGALSLFLPWVTTSYPFGADDEDALIQNIIMRSGYFESALIMSASIFVLGTFLALLTPTAGFVQLAGALGVLSTYPSAYGHIAGDHAAAIGAYLGVASAIIVTISFFAPLGLGYRALKEIPSRGVNWPSHLLTFCPLNPSAGLRINVLCLAGAFLGFASMALPWLLLTETTIPGAKNVVEFNLYFHLNDGSEVFALTAFLSGAVLAFLTPSGGILQLIGAMLFASSVSDDIVTYHVSWGTMSLNWGVGFYLALISAAIVLISLPIPIGTGYRRGKKSIGTTLLVWGEAAPAYIMPGGIAGRGRE